MLASCPAAAATSAERSRLGSLEGGRGFGRLSLECRAGGGVFLQRRVVSRLKFLQLRRMPTVRFLTRRLRGSKFPVKTRASVSFLSEQAFERCLALVRGGTINRGALYGVLMRSPLF